MASLGTAGSGYHGYITSPTQDAREEKAFAKLYSLQSTLQLRTVACEFCPMLDKLINTSVQGART